MRLSIITINRNNASGLEKTMQSVATQTFKEFEYIVIDGASTDDSVEVVKAHVTDFDRLQWVSEPDSGIYNAMNKGIRMASGDYVQILNSGDCLAADDVLERMLAELERTGNPSILYGNMVKTMPNGKRLVDKGFVGQDITFLDMFEGTLNHGPSFIRRNLFEQYGYYDESLKIVSDWKWFIQAFILGKEEPKYLDMDVTVFDMTGLSETYKDLANVERKQVLEQLFPEAVLADYEKYAIPLEQIKRLQRHPWAYKMVWLLERCLFKLEKATRKNIV